MLFYYIFFIFTENWQIMNFLRKYKKQNSSIKIKRLSDKYMICNYNLNDNDTIDVDENVYLHNKNLRKIPLDFNIVNGSFDCNDNRLRNLKKSPNIVSDFFDCSNNNLKSLKNAPSIVKSHFFCDENKLKSLKYCPGKVGGKFDCSFNRIESLEYYVWNNYNLYCYYNNINTFDFFPSFKKNVIFDHNPIYHIYMLFEDMNLIELTYYYDFAWDGVIQLERLKVFLDDCGKEYTYDYLKSYLKKNKWKYI